MEEITNSVKMIFEYDEQNSSPLSRVKSGESVARLKDVAETRQQMSRSTVKLEPEPSDEEDEPCVQAQDFQFVEVDPKVEVKDEIEIFEEMPDLGEGALVPETRDDQSLMCSSDLIKIISSDNSSTRNFLLEIREDFTCNLAADNIQLEKESSSTSLENSAAPESRQNYISLLICPDCGSVFSGQEDLARHQSECNSASAPVESAINFKQTSEIIKTFKCTDCRKILYSSIDFARHVLTHAKYRLRSCRTCGMVFTKKQYLNKHMKLHKSTRVLPSADHT